MKAVIQRVLSADLKVDGKLISEIGAGYVIFLGVKKGDTKEIADYFIKKIPPMRICEDENGKINKSIIDTKGEILLVSQFTLYGDCRRGSRPSFTDAARPEQANALYEQFNAFLREEGVQVETGRFQTHMMVDLTNDGPVTVLIDSSKNF